ncbi:AMP-binding protein [Kordiimonas gwangyangensis]|uniref:AMP-binding protein n=1 Tax=Kordiimonas gwangyangensis TaxID=288022 RepID=UPI0004702A3D|nr:AMP-binding protein [Kordiimonas gwangyangensis]
MTCQVVAEAPPENWARVPIGWATDNVELTILDASLKPVPEGEDGELFIGGVQLADGYLHAEDLTSKAFMMIDRTAMAPAGSTRLATLCAACRAVPMTTSGVWIARSNCAATG